MQNPHESRQRKTARRKAPDYRVEIVSGRETLATAALGYVGHLKSQPGDDGLPRSRMPGNRRGGSFRKLLQAVAAEAPATVLSQRRRRRHGECDEAIEVEAKAKRSERSSRCVAEREQAIETQVSLMPGQMASVFGR